MVLYGYNDMEFYDRVRMLGFFFRWTELRVNRYPRKIDCTSSMKLARSSIMDIANALYFGASGFDKFIQRVHEKSRQIKEGEMLMSEFYYELHNFFLKYCPVDREDETSRVFMSNQEE